MAYEYLKLDSAGWTSLEERLNTSQSNKHLPANLLRHLKELGATFVIIDTEYLDRDFSEAYSAFYSRLFRRHTKICSRLLFFDEDLERIFSQDAESRARALEAHGGNFLGYVIIRPIDQAAIAQVVMKVPPSLAGLESYLLVKSPIQCHLLGATLEIEGIPASQQDQRIGACAQAAVWTCVRHFYYRHRGPWISMVGIHAAAMERPSWLLSRTLPNGSEYLSQSEMVSALAAAGRKPLTYMKDIQQPPGSWSNMRPEDVINRYVDSGIPVVVWINGNPVGHVVVATGQVLRTNPISNLPQKPTRAQFCEAFLVNDDQLGANLRMPIQRNSAVGETPYSVEDVIFLLIGLPDKVYLSAETAEELAWDSLHAYRLEWPTLKTRYASDLGTSVQLGDDFLTELAANKVVARTYLTYGWKYKYRAVRNLMSEELKTVASFTELPRYVWVTEFGTTSSFGSAAKKNRRIFAHCVVDATAKNMGAASRLIFHAPGYAFNHLNEFDKVSHQPGYARNIFPIRDDRPYCPKRRGETEFP